MAAGGWLHQIWIAFREDFLPRTPRRTTLLLMLTATLCASLVSISAAQILLAGTAIGLVLDRRRLKLRPLRPIPLILYALAGFMLWSILSALASHDPLVGLQNLKKLLLFGLLPIILVLLDRPSQARWILGAMLATMAVSATLGITQFIMQWYHPLRRIHGLLGHHMTFSGQLMLLLLALAAALLFHRRQAWSLTLAGLGLSLLLGTALLLTLTRNSWLGLTAGIVVLLAIWRPRWLLVLPLLAGLVFAAAPGQVRERLHRLLDPRDPGNAARVDMLRTGLRMIADRPVFGVGPRMIEEQVYDYGADPRILPCFYQHLHNNFVQLAAERGLPTLACWLWFMGLVLWQNYRRFRQLKAASARDALFFPALGLGAAAALLVSGLFEFNFGDSEVLLVFLALAGFSQFDLSFTGDASARAAA